MGTTVTRRSFLQLASGALASLKVVPGISGAFFLATAPQEALAADDTYDPAHIVLIDPDELGIQVIDVASGLALADAYVSITSYAQGARTQTIEGYTDTSGVWVTNVADLSEPEGLQSPIKSYEFYARIEVEKEGFRPFTTALVRAVAGQGLAVGTQPIEEGMPYPRRASLNEYDILYTATEFIRSSENDATCTLELLVENLPKAATSVVAELRQGDDLLVEGTRFTAKDNSVLVSFAGTFLKAGEADAFSAGAGLSVNVTYASGASSEISMSVPLNLVVMDAPEGVEGPLTDADAYRLMGVETEGLLADDGKKTFSLFNRSSVEDPGLSFPKDWPVIGGQKLKIWTPETWFGFAVDPFGFIRISVKTPPLGMKDKYGKKQEDQKWGFHPRSDARSQIDKAWEKIAEAREKDRQFMGNWDPFWGEGLNPEALTRDQPTKKLSITAVGELAAILQWKTKGYIPIYSAQDLEGIATAHIMAGIDYLYKQQFVAGCIPMIFSFNVKANLDFGVTADIASKTFGDFLANKYDLDLSKSGIIINFCIAGSISLGVGVDGLLSASLRGTLTFTFYLGFHKDKELPSPHFAFYLGFTAKVILQFLLFTHEWTPLAELQEKISGKEPLYDNWNSKASLASYLRSNPGSDERMSLFEFMNEGTEIVGNDTLAQTSEFLSNATLRANDIVEQSLIGMLECKRETFACKDGCEYDMQVYVPMDEGRFETLKNRALASMGTSDDEKASLSDMLQAAAKEEDLDVVFVFGSDGDDLDAQPTLGASERYSFERPSAKVAGLGLMAGVCPSSEVCMSEDVFSDPRTKVVSIFGRLCVVRVATVTLGTGDARTRLVLQEIPAEGAYGAPVLLDFKLTVGRYPRYEYFDYSFDVCETTTTDERGQERCDLHLLVLSGRRDDDDDTTLVGAAQGHIFSYVRYAFTNPDDLSERFAVAMQVTPDKIQATDCDWDNHLYLTPQIKLTETGGQKACVMSYVDRAGKDEDGVLRDSASDTCVGVGMFFAKVDEGGRKDTPPVLSLPDLSMLREKIGDMGDLTLTEMGMIGQASGYKTIKFAGEDTHYLLLDVNPSFKVQVGDTNETLLVPGIENILRVSDQTIDEVLGAGVEVDPDESELFPDTQLDLCEVPGEDYFLTCVGGRLQKVTWGIDGSSPYPKLEPIGPEGVQVTSFAVDPTGEYLYWPTVSEGDAPTVLDESGNPQETGQERAYRIMCCRMRNGVFSKPFLLAEQHTHGFDTLNVLENTHEGISFVSCEVQDAREATANMWFTVVPHLRSFTVAYLGAQSAIVHAGDRVSFKIALRNDGNTYLKQAKVRLESGDGRELGVQEIVFSEKTTLVSQWNPQGPDGKPTGVEFDYALAPGATSLYLMDGFTVPADAPHDLYVYASIVEGSLTMAEESEGLRVMAEGDTQEFLGLGLKRNALGEIVEAGLARMSVIDAKEVEVDTTDLRSSDVTFSSNGKPVEPAGNNSGGTQGSRRTNASSNSRRQTYAYPTAHAPYPMTRNVYGYSRATTRTGGTSGTTSLPVAGTGSNAGAWAGTAPATAGTLGTGYATSVGSGTGTGATAGGASGTTAPVTTTGAATGSDMGQATTSRLPLSKTGDDTPALGATAGLLGVAGAALLAYSRRRERIERETNEGR